MTKLFVVMGDFGEYSSRRVWPIRIVSTEENAQQLVKKYSSEIATILKKSLTSEEEEISIRNFEWNNNLDVFYSDANDPYVIHLYGFDLFTFYYEECIGEFE